jgi:hypothetical protein
MDGLMAFNSVDPDTVAAAEKFSVKEWLVITERLLLIGRLEAILEYAQEAHAGLAEAERFHTGLQRLIEMPYTPPALQKVRPGFEASNRTIGALRLLIRDLRTNG